MFRDKKILIKTLISYYINIVELLYICISDNSKYNIKPSFLALANNNSK